MRCRTVALGVLLATLSGAAGAAPCVDQFERGQVRYYGWSEFFRSTPFGTVGFSRGNRLVYVPNPGVSCVSLAWSPTPIRFVFNNHGAAQAATGYVSFKLFGFQSKDDLWIRSLGRSGPWLRGDKAMKDPWRPDPDVRRRPDGIVAYENFHRSDGGDETSFDLQFGVMHGTPQESDSDSWRELVAMDGGANVADPAAIKYVAHELQRVQSSPDKTVPNSPVDYVTKRFEYGRLVLRVFSPLEGGQFSTLAFEFVH